MFIESRGLLYRCSIICILVLTVNEHYINLSLCVYIYTCTCYVYFIFIFHEICSVSIVSAYSSQGFMAIGNISTALTFYICPCKTAQAECQIQLLEQRVALKVFLESHCNYEPPKWNLPLKLQGVTQPLTHFRLPEHCPLSMDQQFAELPYWEQTWCNRWR